jgi:4,4'-diaponeurosporenoate glycosyltransferase
MYPEGFFTLLNGWTKNMALGAQKSSIWTILMISGLMTASFGIPMSLLKSCADSIGHGISSATVSYISLFLAFGAALYASARRLGSFSPLIILLYPVHAAFFGFVFLRSTAMKVLRIPIDWRGRKVIIR